jgi:hypothetical protein
MAREHTTLLLETLCCADARSLAAALLRAPGVTRVYVDTATEAVFIEHRTEQSTCADLRRIIELLGIRVRSSTRCARSGRRGD